MINYSWAGFDLHFKLSHLIVNFYLLSVSVWQIIFGGILIQNYADNTQQLTFIFSAEFLFLSLAQQEVVDSEVSYKIIWLQSNFIQIGFVFYLKSPTCAPYSVLIKICPCSLTVEGTRQFCWPPVNQSLDRHKMFYWLSMKLGKVLGRQLA